MPDDKRQPAHLWDDPQARPRLLQALERRFPRLDPHLLEDAAHHAAAETLRAGKSRHIENPAAYAFAAARYHILRTIHRSRLSRPLADLADTPATPDTPHLQSLEERQRLYDALASQLTPHERALIHLRYVNNLRHDQIAARIDAKPAAIRKQLSRALEKLRKALADDPNQQT